jgi:hypothetical protein
MTSRVLTAYPACRQLTDSGREDLLAEASRRVDDWVQAMGLRLGAFRGDASAKKKSLRVGAKVGCALRLRRPLIRRWACIEWR